MENLLQEVRQAARSLLRSPMLTGAAVLCLALGIGPNTAVFSIVDAVLLQPLPYQDPDEVVLVWGQFRQEGQTRVPLSPPELFDVKEQLTTLEGLAAVGPQLVNITGEAEPERLVAARATEGIFSLLGVNAAAGRLFAPDDHRADAEQIAVLSHAFWSRRFAADRAVLDQVVRLDDRPTRVVGVLPPGFQFGPFEHDVWLPTLDSATQPPRSARFLTAVGRLADGVSLEASRRELEVIAQRMQRSNPEAYPQDSGWSLSAVPARQDLVGDVRGVLLVLALAVGFVLLIACANIVNLLLARAVGRRKEVAIHTALGAGRGALVRRFLIESLLLVVAGAALGLLFAAWAIRTLVTVYASALPRASEVGVDLRVLLFTLGIAVTTGLVVGLAPAFQATRFNLRATLAEGGKTSDTGSAGGRVRAGLVVAEVALALIVLIGGSLVVKGFLQLLAVDPGYRSEGVLSLQLTLSRQAWPEDHQVAAFFGSLVDRVEAMPGVTSAAVVSHPPASAIELTGEVVPEGWPETAGRSKPTTAWRIVSPEYFQTLGIPLLAGRVLDPRDDAERPEVVVLDEALAERLWPAEDPLGKRLRIESARPDGRGLREVVGVVGHVRHQLTGGGSTDQIYLPQAQLPVRIMTLVVRSEQAPEAMVPRIREAIADLGPNLPVEDVQLLSDRVSASISQPRLTSLLFATFAVIALVLAVVGLYGVIAYSAARRSQEIGLRMALGARRGEVIQLVVQKGVLLALAGLVVGVAGALALNRVLQGVLYGVSTTDLPTYALVSLALLAVATLASLVPAWRASRTDPIGALRAE